MQTTAGARGKLSESSGGEEGKGGVGGGERERGREGGRGGGG